MEQNCSWSNTADKDDTAHARPLLSISAPSAASSPPKCSARARHPQTQLEMAKSANSEQSPIAVCLCAVCLCEQQRHKAAQFHAHHQPTQQRREVHLLSLTLKLSLTHSLPHCHRWQHRARVPIAMAFRWCCHRRMTLFVICFCVALMAMHSADALPRWASVRVRCRQRTANAFDFICVFAVRHTAQLGGHRGGRGGRGGEGGSALWRRAMG